MPFCSLAILDYDNSESESRHFPGNPDKEQKMFVFLEGRVFPGAFDLSLIFLIFPTDYFPFKTTFPNHLQEYFHRISPGGVDCIDKPCLRKKGVNGNKELLMKSNKIKAVTDDDYLVSGALHFGSIQVHHNALFSPQQSASQRRRREIIELQVLLQKGNVVRLPVSQLNHHIHAFKRMSHVPKSQPGQPTAASTQLKHSQISAFSTPGKDLSSYSLSPTEEEIGSYFLSFPHPSSSCVDWPFEMKQILVDRQRRLREKGGRTERVAGQQMVWPVIRTAFKEVKLACGLICFESACSNDVAKLFPIPAAATLLLLHKYKRIVFNQQSMSQISSKKVRYSWKISDTSRIYPSEESIREQKPALPEKFSPTKNTPRESKIFTASKEKLKLIKGDRSVRENSISPFKGDVNLVNNLSLKESVPLNQSPKKVTFEQFPSMRSQESLFLNHLQSDSPIPKLKSQKQDNFQLLKSKQDSNIRAIHQIRVDFAAFKTQVWAELVQQREMIAKISSDLATKIEQNRMEQVSSPVQIDQSKRTATFPELAEVARQVQEAQGKISSFSSRIQKKYSDLKLDQIEAVKPIPFTPTSKQQQCRTPIDKLQQVSCIPERIDKIVQRVGGSSNPLQKCSQIAETIGILSQINSSPVNSRAKSIQRLNIEQYKQKLISISRSNDQLIKEPLRAQLREERAKEEGKVKGSFKLDKFYNAIEKLKEQVNEIRNINDMQQVKKLKILKVHE